MPKQPCLNPYGLQTHVKFRSQKGLSVLGDETRRLGKEILPNFDWDHHLGQVYICAKCRRQIDRDFTQRQRLHNAQQALQALNEIRQRDLQQEQERQLEQERNQLQEQQQQQNEHERISHPHQVQRDQLEESNIEPSAPPQAVVEEIVTENVHPATSSFSAAKLNVQKEDANAQGPSIQQQSSTTSTAGLYPSLPSPTNIGNRKRQFAESPEAVSVPSLTGESVFTSSSASSRSTAASSAFTPLVKKTVDLNKTLEQIGASPIVPSDRKKRAVIARKFLQFQDFAETALSKFSKLKPKSTLLNNPPCTYCNSLLNELRGKYQQQNNRQEKYKVLTCIPKRFTIKKIRSTTGCSMYESKVANRLKSRQGAFSWPSYHYGRAIDPKIVEKIINFYLMDSNSRTSPNTRDVVRVKTDDGQTQLAAKRRILHNLNELYNSFKAEYPDIKVSVAKFASLRPKNCVWPGKSRQHNVCVCEIHQNFLFLLQAVDIEIPIKQIVEQLVCGKPECYLRLCMLCPKQEYLDALYSKIPADSEITYAQWTHTDSIDLRRVTVSREDYIKTVNDYIPKIAEHDFIYREQSKYIAKIKGELLQQNQAICVQVDFSQNYTCVAQNSTQSFYWTSKQVTVHPFVVSWWDNVQKKILQKSYCVISDDLRHDANTFHVFRTEVMRKVISDLESIEIKKVYYVSDGAGSQYKNYKNFANLMFHNAEYAIEAEWVFTATSHGKSTCDAIGAVTKCAARRESLKEGVIIMNAKELHDFCKEKFAAKIETLEYLLCTRDDVENTREMLEERYRDFHKVVGIRKHHVFVPLADGKLRMYRTAGNEVQTDLWFKKEEETSVLFAASDLIIGYFYAFIYDNSYHVGLFVTLDEAEEEAIFQTLKLNRNTGVCSWPEPAVYLEVPFRDIFYQTPDPKDNAGRYIVEDLKTIKSKHKWFKNTFVDVQNNT